MWWLPQMVAEHAEQVAAPTVVAARPEEYVTPKVGGTNDPMLDALIDLTNEVSPLVACRILFARYLEVDSPQPLASDETHNPCPDGHSDTFDWLSPRNTMHQLCRRCGRPA